MATWQRRARLFIAAGAVAFAAVLVFAFRNKAPEAESVTVTSTDPKAVVESASGTRIEVNREQERVRVTYGRLLTYADGSVRMLDVQVSTERAGGRLFTLTADEGLVHENQSSYDFTGNMHLTATDGLSVRAESATYAERDGTVRVPGAVEFARGRLSGTGIGMTYNKNSDLMTILRQAVIHVAPGAEGSGGVDVESLSSMISRPEGILRFEGAMRAVRGSQVITSDLGIGHLHRGTELLELLELRGHSAITTTGATAGSLEHLAGRDIDLRMAPDGETLERAVVLGDATASVAGTPGRGRSIQAASLDIALAPDGATPTSLEGRDDVLVTLPADGGGPTRTVRAQSLRSIGDAHRGLTRTRFDGRVHFLEQGTDVSRSAQSDVLEATLTPGLGDIQQATFTGGVQFVDGDLTGTAAVMRYGVTTGTLALSRSRQADSETPRVVSDRMSVNAEQIDVKLADKKIAPDSSSSLSASGAVTSELLPNRGDDQRKLPSMLESDRPVIVVADKLTYDAQKGTAAYSGRTRLSQADTTIAADTLTLEEHSGNLVAEGSVVTATVLEQTNRNGKRERTPSRGRSSRFHYQELDRRATYTGDAQVGGPQGDLAAGRIELFLQASGKEVDRAEAYDTVSLVENGRKTTGNRLTYLGAEDRYIVTGTPVTTIDECGRATTGRTLTFERRADRVVVDGAEQSRTRTQGAAKCP